MVDYAYTTVTGKIKPLLDKVRQVGIPPKVQGPWLKTVGFTSSNDTSLITVLKFIGLVDGSGVPTPTWSAYRGVNHKVVLGEAIRTGYAELYAVYPDAHKRTNQELTHVFSTSSSAGQQAISKTVQTFKALVEEAEFSVSSPSNENTMHSGPLQAAPNANNPPSPIPAQNGPAVHIDIQIHISPDSTAQQIDKIFESMAKHLYGRKEE